MKRSMFSFLMAFVLFALLCGFTQQKETKNAQVRQWQCGEGLNTSLTNEITASVDDPVLQWNTFIGGSSSYERAKAIAIDRRGNICVIGGSTDDWGNPVNPFAGNTDAFVAKIDPNGTLKWSTFLGGNSWDYGEDIIMDRRGNIYVLGLSESTWGNPVYPFTGDNNVFVAKISSKGMLEWNTFLGGSDWNEAYELATDGRGNIYVTGTSRTTWGDPLNPFAGIYDAFVVKLNANGDRLWHTFLGGSAGDNGCAIETDPKGNIYVTGVSYSTWGSPVNPFKGGFTDAFVARLNPYGVLQWNTFIGGWSDDGGQGIAIDSRRNICVIGTSSSSWGIPLHPFGGGYNDAFVAKLNPNGVLKWNTFLGGDDIDFGYDLVTDGVGNIYATGVNRSTWGNPVYPFSGNDDAFLAKLNTYGGLQWHTFLGGSEWDYGYGIAIDSTGNIYSAGLSNSTWGNPVNPFSGNDDAFVVRIEELGRMQVTYKEEIPLRLKNIVDILRF